MTAPRGLRHQTSLHRIAVHSASVEAVVEKETGVRHFSRFLRSGLQNRRHRSGLRAVCSRCRVFYGTNTPPALTGSTCPGTVVKERYRFYSLDESGPAGVNQGWGKQVIDLS